MYLTLLLKFDGCSVLKWKQACVPRTHHHQICPMDTVFMSAKLQ